HPHHRVREAQTRRRSLAIPGGHRSEPAPSAANPDDLDCIHCRGFPAGGRAGRGCRNAAGHGHCCFCRHDRGDLVWFISHAGVLCHFDETALEENYPERGIANYTADGTGGGGDHMKTSNNQHPRSREAPNSKLQVFASEFRCCHSTGSAPYVRGDSPKASGRFPSLGFGASLVLGCWLLMLFLEGCAVGPNYHRPETAIPADYKSKDL